MISLGVHKAEVISRNQIRIGDIDLPFEASAMKVGDTISVLSSMGGQLLFLEKVTTAMMDEVTIRNQIQPQYVVPASGVITSIFGPRRDPVYGGDEFHDGIDISGTEGDPIFAIDSGTIRGNEDAIYGTYLEIDHGNGMKSVYGHLSEVILSEGPVSKGQMIGKMGNTGKSSGPHLHLGLDYYGKYLNPRVFFGKTLMLLGKTVIALEEAKV